MLLHILYVLAMIVFIVATCALGFFVALVLWYLAILIHDEVVEFMSMSNAERRRIREQDDELFTKWVRQNRARPKKQQKPRHHSQVGRHVAA